MDFDLLIDAGDFEREVAQRSSVRKDDELLLGISEAFVRNVKCVIASRNGVNLKRAFGVGDGGALPIGLRGTEFDLCALNGTVLCVMNDATNCAEDAGDGAWRRRNKENQKQNTETKLKRTAKHEISPQNGMWPVANTGLE